MTDITIFKIGGRTFDLPVVDFAMFIENLDSPATGRMQTDGWLLFREPQGTIININVTVGLSSNRNTSDFTGLINEIKSFGRTDFKSITFMTPSGAITQDMYATVGEISAVRFESENETYWGALEIKFVAKEAYE